LVSAGTALIAVTYGLARFSLGLFVPELAHAFDLSATAVGWIMAGSFTGYLCGLAGADALVGRFGPRAVASMAGLVGAAGLAGVAASVGPVTLGLAVSVAGSSAGLAAPSLATAVERGLARRRRAGAQTVINAGTSLGLVAAVPVGLATAATWRLAWAGFAVVAVAAAVAVAIALGPPLSGAPAASQPGRAWAHSSRAHPLRAHPSRRRASRRRPSAGGQRWWAALPGARAVAGNQRWWAALPGARLAAAAVLLGMASAAFWGFGRELLETAAGLSPAVGRGAWAVVGVGGLAGAGAGHAVERVGLRATLLAAWLALAAGLGWLATAPASPAVALTLAGLFGVGYMALTGLLIVWGVRERPQRPARAVALAFVLLAAGQIAASPVVGALAQHVGLGAAFAVAAVAAGLGALVTPPRGDPAGSPVAGQALDDQRAGGGQPVVVDGQAAQDVGALQQAQTRPRRL
jgi:predicted MFS family arabinose efflux permease